MKPEWGVAVPVKCIYSCTGLLDASIEPCLSVFLSAVYLPSVGVPVCLYDHADFNYNIIKGRNTKFGIKVLVSLAQIKFI